MNTVGEFIKRVVFGNFRWRISTIAFRFPPLRNLWGHRGRVAGLYPYNPAPQNLTCALQRIRLKKVINYRLHSP
jgi:hypothetical protein